MYDWIRRVLGRPRADAWIAVVSTVFVLPSVFSGLAADDFVHELALGRVNPIGGFRRSAFDLFRFATPDVTPSLLDDGVLPWWADREVRFAFLRPLAAATHWLDHVLYPHSPILMHVHTVGWSLLSVLAAGAAYRAVQGPGLGATLALLFYAIDDARGSPVAWVANRNELVACALSVFALALHCRGAGGRAASPERRRSRFLAPVLLGLSLLASEGAVAVTAYLFAYALFVEKGALPARLVGLWPYAVVVVVWAAVYRGLGYGIAGSGVYFDPIHDPVDFVRYLPERFTMLWLAQLGGPWSEGWNAYSVMFPGVEVWVVVLAVVVFVFVGFLFAPILRRDPIARFWLVGAVIGTLPACGAFPADRLLPWIGVGGMGLTARFFADFLENRPRAGFTLARAGAVVVVGAHLGLAPLLLPLRCMGIRDVRAALDRADRTVPRDPSIEEKLAIYMNPAADPFASYVPITRAALGIPRPKAQRWLAAGTMAVGVERVDERTLRISPHGGLLVLPSEKLFRNTRTHPFRVGERIETTELTLTMTQVTADGRPSEYLARFDRPLEDTEYVWFKWQGDGYAPFPLPAIGEKLTLPPADLVTVAYGVDSPITKALRGK